MKVFVLIVCIGVLSVAVFARDLERVAHKERARRNALAANEHGARTFTDADLETYAQQRQPVRLGARVARPEEPRDMAREEAYWQQEKKRHDRDLAKVDARIRRLQTRLAERQRHSRRKGWVRDDPTITLIEESLESLREERDKLDLDFRERARKAGAFPGWIR